MEDVLEPFARQPFDPAAAAQAFVTARRAGRALAGYPGPVPTTLAEAYACQDAAIAQWSSPVAGWKVGMIAHALVATYGEERIVGPVFADALQVAEPHGENVIPVFVGGFAAVEAEFVFRLRDDVPPTRMRWSVRDALATVGALHVGIETAGSPLATINALGPAVTASDFGNNNGLVVGAEIADWQTHREDAMTAETFVDDTSVGRGGAINLPGGPIAALAFALGRLASRGRTLRAGDWISTGASTGIHPILAGQHARASFGAQGRLGEIRCRALPAGARA